MTDTFRALCAEVLAYNNGESPYNFSGLNPYDRDNAAFDAWQDIRQRLKSALRRAQPEPEGPTDEELLAAQDQAVASFPPIHPEAEPLSAVEYARELEIRKARAVLARCGRPTPQPVSVSERPPGPEDCDKEGKCWWGRPSEELCNSDWFLATRAEVDEFCDAWPPIVFLPHWALPVPTKAS